MQQSWPYRNDLLSFAKSFERRGTCQLWREDSLAKAEKMLFVGFFLLRKLIECQKVTDQCAQSSVVIRRSAISRRLEVSAFNRDDLYADLDSAQWVESKVDVHQLADKVIHAWWIIPISDESSGLSGYIFTTDKHRNKELWCLPTSSVIEVFKRFGLSQITELHSKRNEGGRLTYWQAK
jgi:hypothetical protein